MTRQPARQPEPRPGEFLTVDELIDELNVRFPQVLFCGLRNAKVKGKTEHTIIWRGDAITALGLAVKAADAINNE